MIDDLITVLKRAKNCEKITCTLRRLSQNLLFTDEVELNEKEKKYAKHVHESILECIKIIEKENDPT